MKFQKKSKIVVLTLFLLLFFLTSFSYAFSPTFYDNFCETEKITDLTILNTQSYPIVGGNWTVKFNTTGIADLTIFLADETNWNKAEKNNDLEFLELKCGSQTLNYRWTNNAVFIENYSCDQTSYEISNVLTSGKHALKFSYGNIIRYANNFASENITFVLPTKENNSYTPSNWVYINITSDEDLNQSLVEWGNSSGYTNISMSNSSTTNWHINITDLQDYAYNYTILAQNTSGYWVQTGIRYIDVDTTTTLINIQSPLSYNYSTPTIWFNTTLNKPGDWCGYSLDGASNITMTNSSGNWNAKNTSMTIGQHNVRFYCNDTAGNMNSTPVRYFNVKQQMTGKLYISLSLPNTNYVCSKQSGIIDSGTASFNYPNPEDAYVNSFGSNIVYSLSSDRAANIIAQNYPSDHKISIFTNSEIYLGFTKGDCSTITKKYSRIKDSTLLYELSPAFAYIDSTDEICAKAGARYSNLKLSGESDIPSGKYNFLVSKLDPDSQGRPTVDVRRS